MTAASAPANAPATVERCVEYLSPLELHRLTLYKWRYALEAFGFAPAEVRRLLFVKWLHVTQRVDP